MDAAVNTKKVASALRADLALIAGLVKPGDRVLDVGCGDGALLGYLTETKGADARGIELSHEGVSACVARGLSVIQGDADTDLADYPADAFDLVILSQTIQATRQPRRVLQHLLRIGRGAVVSIPNYGHWSVRLSLMFRGRVPLPKGFDQTWHESENIHPCTVKDFLTLCRELPAHVDAAWTLRRGRPPHRLTHGPGFANLMAETAVFRLSRAREN